MADRIYPGGTGAPAYAGNPGYDYSGSNGDDTSTNDGGSSPPTDGDGGTPAGNGGDGGGSGGDGSGVVSVGGSDGGINVIGGDTNGDGDGLINVHSDATGGVLGDSLDGTHIDAINPDSLVDAHVPGLVDATVGDGTVANIIGGADGGDGNGGGLIDGLHGIQVDALHDGNLLEAHAPGIADATVGGSELGGLANGLEGVTDGVGLGGLTGGDGITVEALNGEYVAEAHAPGPADATVGGYSELGGLLGSVGDAGDAVSNTAGGLGATDALHGITVDALNGDYLAEAHAPQIADATVGGAELGNLVGGGELGGVLGGLDLAHDGGGLLGDVLHVGSGGDIAGLDVGHLLDTSSS